MDTIRKSTGCELPKLNATNPIMKGNINIDKGEHGET